MKALKPNSDLSQDGYLKIAFQALSEQAHILELMPSHPGAPSAHQTVAQLIAPGMTWHRASVDALGAFQSPNPLDCILIQPGPLITPELLLSIRARLALHGLIRIVSRNISNEAALLSMICGESPHGLSHHEQAWTFPSLAQALMDCGFMPEMLAARHESFNPVMCEKLVQLAVESGVPETIAQSRISRTEMIVSARLGDPEHIRSIQQPRDSHSEISLFTAVVPVTNAIQFNANIGASPGLKEVNTPIIAVEHASSAAQGFAEGALESRTDWILYCHQDVYFPAGTGRMINEWLRSTDPARHPIIGFAGLSEEKKDGKHVPAGLCLDGENLFDHPSAHNAVSIDEFAVLIHRKQAPSIAPELGWHLWATDLCLQTMERATTQRAAIVRAPLHHNTWNDRNVNRGFGQAAQVLAARHPNRDTIETLVSAINRSDKIPKLTIK